MNKLLLLCIILGLLFVLYWFQSKIDEQSEYNYESEKEFISLTDTKNSIKFNGDESDESNNTLQSFNPAVLEEDDNHDTNLSSVSGHKLRKMKKNIENDSQFTDSDLMDDNQREGNSERELESRLDDLDN